MANATARVPMTTRAWGDDKIRRRPVDTAAIYYPGAMIAINASGRATKCDDTAGLTFDGINSNVVRLQVFTGDDTTDPAKQIVVQRPWGFGMRIASADEATDLGKPVYALFDDEVGYSSSNSIHVGWVDDVISSTFVFIRPAWVGQRGTATFDGATLTFTGATGANSVAIPDNLADALSVKEGSNAYLTFVTTNGSEAVQLRQNTTVTGTLTLTSTSATAVRVGPNGATNPTLTINCGTASAATGLSITAAAAAGGVALAVTSSGTNEAMSIDAKGSGPITLGGTSTGNVLSPRSILSTGTGIGYGTGAGGTVTQATNKSTGVTLNKTCGQITMNNATLNAGVEVGFTVTNSTVAATDTVVASIASGATADSYHLQVDAVGAGSFRLSITNVSASNLGEALVINFAVIKGVTS